MAAEKLGRSATYPGEFSPLRPHIRFRWNGEKRPPKAGEWYLSGSIITAYKAQSDLSYPYHIAEAVEVTCTCGSCPVHGRRA
jgi:hypothetical protein